MPQTPFRGLFEKSPLKTPKAFGKGVFVKPKQPQKSLSTGFLRVSTLKRGVGRRPTLKAFLDFRATPEKENGMAKKKSEKVKKQGKTPEEVAEEEGISPEEAKKKALKNAISMLEKKFGQGTVMRLGETKSLDVSAVSTGSLTLDLALGVGGLPRGRIVEIYGPESSGKTTVALHAVAEVQRQGGTAAFVDAEHALDPAYAKNLGVDIDNLLVSQPDSGEQALEICEALVRSCAVEIVVVDSVAALVPQAEIDGEMGASHVGLQARLMSQAMRKLSGAAAKAGAIVVFINQLREKVGVMYGNPEVTTGGKALKFYASVRIDVRRSEILKDGKESVGNKTRCKVVKNKVAPPFKEAEFDIVFGKGISKLSEILEIAVEQGIVEKSGSWLSYGGSRIGQGREKAKAYLEENPEIAKEIEEKIRELGKQKDLTTDMSPEAILDAGDEDPEGIGGGDDLFEEGGDAGEDDFDIAVLGLGD